jgi:hypothetical protein
MDYPFVAGQCARVCAALADAGFVCYNARRCQFNTNGLRTNAAAREKFDDVTPYRALSGCNRPFGHDLADG